MASDSDSRRGGERFTTTRWSLVVAAGRPDSVEAHEALASLCGTYWRPIYAFLRRQGNDSDRARDLTQGFFQVLLEKNYVGDARRERGRFRTFLLASVKHYAANERDREHALKRGGGRIPIPIEDLEAADLEAEALTDDQTPEMLFDRRWARALIEAAMQRLREEMSRSSGVKRFETLVPYLTGDNEAGYDEAAVVLGISPSAAKVATHRLRQRFRSILRDEVAQTVGDASEVDEEIRHLFSILG